MLAVVLVLGAVSWLSVVETGCRVLAVRVVETGCRWCCELACRCWVLVLCTWGAQGAGAGLRVIVVCVVEIGCWCRVLVLCA